MQSSLLWWPTFARKDVEIRPDDDVEEVENPRLNSQPINKTTTGHTCAACEKTFGSNRTLEKHMDDKHQEADCPFCDKVFPSKQWFKRVSLGFFKKENPDFQGLSVRGEG